MKGKQVCVTGANGFIGRRLVEALSREGCSIRVLTRRSDFLPNGVEVMVGDLTSISCNLDQFLVGCELIFHCAAEVSNVSIMQLLHVNGTQRLLDAALKEAVHSKKKIHWVQLSSVGAYGSPESSDKGSRIVTEETMLNPTSKYEVTKTMADELVIKACEVGSITYSILRPSNVYGAAMTNQSLFNMIEMIDRGLFFYIGKPGASANYVHVDNVVDALIRCGTMQSAKGRVFNVSDHLTLERFVEVIAAELGRSNKQLRIPVFVANMLAITLSWLWRFPLTQSRVKALTNRSVYSIASIQEVLGYQNVVTMEDGLIELVGEYKKRLKHGELK